MKGIIMAGGKGTRLFPSTLVINKHLLPVYDKPMIYYPLATLMLAEIQDILIITNTSSLPLIQQLLGNGAHWGLNIEYMLQNEPRGIAEAFILAEPFIKNDNVCLILGDNIFQGSGLEEKLLVARQHDKGATIFTYHVENPQNYGVVEFNHNGIPTTIVEKPTHPKSNYAITGLYFYDPHVVEIAKSLTPSGRGELEITDINSIYLDKNELHIQTLGRGFAWLDMGTHETLLNAANFVQVMESRQGLKIGCPEEIAWRKKYITDNELLILTQRITDKSYKKHLTRLLEQ